MHILPLFAPPVGGNRIKAREENQIGERRGEGRGKGKDKGNGKGRGRGRGRGLNIEVKGTNRRERRGKGGEGKKGKERREVKSTEWKGSRRGCYLYEHRKKWQRGTWEKNLWLFAH